MFRRMGTVGRACVAILLVGGSFGYAVAQDGDDAKVEVLEVEPIAKADPDPALSPAAQAKAAQAAVKSASKSCEAQSMALSSAKRDNDIIRATCLQDKLDQCNANLQSMKRRQAAMNDAIAAGDAGGSSHELTVINVLSQKQALLAQAANQCVGQDLFDTGETQVKKKVDIFAPDENPSVTTSVPDWPIPFIPPPVSGVS